MRYLDRNLRSEEKAKVSVQTRIDTLTISMFALMKLLGVSERRDDGFEHRIADKKGSRLIQTAGGYTDEAR